MKQVHSLVLAFLLAVVAAGCAPTTPQRGISTSPTPVVISPEAEARQKTEAMRTSLNLTDVQADKVMIVNTTHLKLVKHLKENNQSDKLATARDSYMKQLKEILTAEQFDKFVSMGN